MIHNAFLFRFKLVHRTGQSCAALVACISRPSKVLVALADYSLKCIDIGEWRPSRASFSPRWLGAARGYDFLPVAVTVAFINLCFTFSSVFPVVSLCFTSSLLCTDTCDLVATLRGHEASVKSLSLHSSGRFVLAVSSRDSVLWDLDSFARCRTLNGGQEVGVQDVRCQSSLCYF